MGDDGMLVNFDISADTNVFSQAPKFKGGRWTDRLKAKKVAQHRAKKGPSAGATKTGAVEFNVAENSNAQKGDEAGGRNNRGSEKKINTFSRNDTSGPRQSYAALKRKREDGDSNKPKNEGAQYQQGGKDQFVSSLWTSNPTSTIAFEEPSAAAKDQAPSNAPLADGSSTFTTLGLSPILANHLTTKLFLKAPTAIQKSAIPELISGDLDAFIQAETGSGKTLTYLLPIVNRIMSLSAPPSASTPQGDDKKKFHRYSGVYAVILAPTRELSRQIMTVLSTLIHCKNGPHWIVPGMVIGGEKKKSEKARLRKGVNVLVATPGRLLDHLENTKSLDVSRVRWMIMDEGDRLMELGFEETIGKILEILEKKSLLNGSVLPVSENALPKRRVTMLCSATIKTDVQRLGDISLKEALYIKPQKKGDEEEVDGEVSKGEYGGFMAPAQLKQSYIVAPAKLRLVGLNAILKRAFVRQTATPKVIVFFSCSDSVDFHFEVFSRKPDNHKEESDSSDSEDEGVSKKEKTSSKKDSTGKEKGKDKEKPRKPKVTKNPAVSSAPFLNHNLLLHKLHGSLSQPIRTATLHSFTHTKAPAILFCTDVAARGLDLPNLDLVVQYDPPFARDDHLHRIGRTARAGREGKAVMFLLPGPEEGYVDAVLKKGIREGQLIRVDLDEVIKKGFGEKTDKKREWEDKATEWHLDVERWVQEDKHAQQLAAKAWGSHIRAYTTHTSEEKSMFNHKALHYGHLAKCFGLRDKPGNIKVPTVGGESARKGSAADIAAKIAGKKGKKRALDPDDIAEVPGKDAMKKMRKIAQSMERKWGMSSEFNLG
ncbi:ATP-dependent RNA helicase dbp7 [Rhizina undulata]